MLSKRFRQTICYYIGRWYRIGWGAHTGLKSAKLSAFGQQTSSYKILPSSFSQIQAVTISISSHQDHVDSMINDIINEIRMELISYHISSVSLTQQHQCSLQKQPQHRSAAETGQRSQIKPCLACNDQEWQCRKLPTHSDTLGKNYWSAQSLKCAVPPRTSSMVMESMSVG